MGEYGTILLTAFATLVITVVAGLALEYVKKIKPKLTYSIRESIPIEIGGKKIGANVVHLSNPSSIVVKDAVIKIRASDNELRNGGIECTQGLDYEVNENGDTLQITIPFLKYEDNISITAIIEGLQEIPIKPEVSVRSPDGFKLVLDSELSKNSTTFQFQLGAALIASVSVILSLSTVIGVPYSNKHLSITDKEKSGGTVMTLSASIAGLPNLAQKYSKGFSNNYYKQGPYVYVLALNEKEKTKIEAYKQFLIKTIKISTNMDTTSKSAFSYFIGKIELLQGDLVSSDKWFEKAKSYDTDEFSTLGSLYK